MEIINIFYLIAGLTLIFLSPTFLVHKFKKKYNLNFFDIYPINIILILNIFLILSFFTFNLNYIFFLFLIIGIINILYLYKNHNFNKNYLFLIFLLFAFIYSIKIASNLRLEWDAAVLWIFRAMNFYEGFSFWNFKNIHDGSLAYPHLGTYGWALVWKNSFIDYEYTGRIFYILIYLISIFSVIYKYYFGFLFSVILVFIFTTLTFDLALFSGYQEPLMFSLIIFIFLLGDKINKSNNLNLLHWMCILNANLILWIKNEGLAFIILILFTLLIDRKMKKRIKLFFILTFATLIIIKFSIFHFYFNENLVGWRGYRFIKFDEFFSFEIFERLPLLIFQILIVFFKYPLYLIFILLISYLILSKKLESKDVIYLLFFILNCLMPLSIYYFLDDPRWYFHASVTVDRILYQSSGIYVIFILNFLHRYFFQSKVTYSN
jgi:hypothetical protein